MSTAKLNVWITRFGDACHIEDRELWFVHILDCDGRVIEWCGKKYSFIPAKCGHAEIELPPGCYTVFAGHSPQGQGVPPFGNRLTHVQVVRVNCGDHACVTLFSPSLGYCGTWFAHAVATQLEGLQRADVDIQVAMAAVKAVNAFLEQIPIDRFTVNTQRALEQEPNK
ncbi:MAG: hypothetical protein ACKV2U_06595 [Bryobacteraceae bacterium]